MTRDGLGSRLRRLADRLDRLRPLNHDPEAYFVKRDEIRRDLVREAEALDARERAAPPRERFHAGLLVAKGRTVKAEIRRARRRAPACDSRKPPISKA